MSDITLTLVPWAPGTSVGAYPRRSEQLRPDGPPTGITPTDTEVVADDASLSYNLADGEYWAAAPVNGSDHWQYVSFVAETPFDDEGHALAAAQSENGHWHEVMVDDIGRLSTVDLGPSQPPHGPPPYATLGDIELSHEDIDTRLDSVESSVGIGVLPSATSGTSTRAAILALGVAGGRVILQPGTHTWDVIPTIPPALVGKLQIECAPGAKILLTTAARRCFDWGKVADYDTFRRVDIGPLTVDVNNLGGQHHVVVGPWQNGSWQRKINGNDIHVHDVEILNAPVGTDAATDFRIGVHIGAAASAVSDSLCTWTDCSVRRVRSDGCLQLVAIHGVPVGAEKVANVYHDNIVVEDIDHDLPTTPTAFNAGAHVMAGTKGTGGKITIRRVYGRNSPDVGIESGAWQVSTVDDCDIEDAYDFPYYHVNYNIVASPEAQLLTYSKAVSRRRLLNRSGLSCSGFKADIAYSLDVTGVASTDIFTTASAHGYANDDQVAFSDVTGGTGLVPGTRYYVVGATPTTFQVSATQGGAALNFTTDMSAGVVHPLNRLPASIHFGPGCLHHRLATSAGIEQQWEAADILGPRRVTGELKAVCELPTYNGAANVAPSAVRIRSASTSHRTRVEAVFDVKVTGAQGSTGFVNWRSLILREGLLRFDVDLKSEVVLTGSGNATVIEANIGTTQAGGSAVLSGRLKVDIVPGSRGNTPVGLQFESGALNAVPTPEDIVVHDSNFAGLASTSADVIFNGATTLASRTRYERNTWRAFPQARRATATSVGIDNRADLIAVTDTTAARVITLPAANIVPVGRVIRIKDEFGTAGTNNITVQRSSTDLIEGATTKVINTNYGSTALYSTGSAWVLAP